MNTPEGLITTRRFKTLRRELFAAISDSGSLARWWGPEGFTNTIQTFEFCPGGCWRYVMHGPDGTDYPNVSLFSEIVENERVVLDHLNPNHRFRIVMTFTDEGDGSRLTWHMSFEDPEELKKLEDFVRIANEQNFDRLESLLKNRN